MHVHAPNDWDATTGAGWETGGGRGGGSGSGVLFAGPQVALSSAAGGSCDVPGRPDIGGPGSCFVSLCTSWSKPRLGALGVLKSGHLPPASGPTHAAVSPPRQGACPPAQPQGQDGQISVPPAPLTAA